MWIVQLTIRFHSGNIITKFYQDVRVAEKVLSDTENSELVAATDLRWTWLNNEVADAA